MIFRRPLRFLFYLNALVVVLLVGYKTYLNFYLPDFQGEHTRQLNQITEQLEGRESFSFAVVGNINNSIGIFERMIVPQLNHAGLDFMISAGNAVSDGTEDKYRALYGSLGRLGIPYILTFGQHEYENFGSYRYYEHFGPHFFSFREGSNRFVFIDSTGKTPWEWQIRWLEDILANEASQHTFLFSGKPLFQSSQDILFDSPDDYLGPLEFRRALLQLIEKHRVDVVFSANIATFEEQTFGDTRFITTGGAGGLVLNNDVSFYHYVRVDVTPESVDISLEPMQVGQHPVLKILESFWFFIYSLVYVGYLNFILLLSALLALAIFLYARVFRARDYYPDYDLDPSPWENTPLRVAMFTNNYFPFIGGVPISIDRLNRGLRDSGNTVLTIAPTYQDQPEQEPDVERIPSMLTMGQKQEFRMANIFCRSTRRRVREFRPDLIHVHHPIWVGSLGVYLARRIKVPVIYTYHTRLEHYAHFVPLPGRLFRNFISHALIKRFANKCDGVIVPTYSAEDYLRVIGVKCSIFVQPTGIEFEAFQCVDNEHLESLRQQYNPDNRIVLISVARLSNEKNIDFMLEALAGLQTDENYRLLLIGDGHERERLQTKIETLGLAEQVCLVGSVPPENMAAFYNLADIFVFASKSETQGMVILEAMAAGLPVVAVRSSGIDDVIREGYNGFKTIESRERWREPLQTLMTDESLRQTLGDNARQFAESYSIEHFAGNVKTIYATVMAARKKP